ncbi:hypothetical protein [Tenacibaculum finnmarkense]|uniref:hypothetical protein n=1 Tax=Tenacibaculum finnmarkense TaxID=2781243 RepID=UPI001E2AD671|nr:hypothetical protein [Tenacibaculum finnmarkense]MCD8448050.1 hypothetical protein [Tenacibaculum finnmarkense genomovar finnmarkense]
MNCIICDNIADEKGSHLIPASLIKNCVGNHYKEESYSIDSKNSKINVYYGRDNLKNNSTIIQKNTYKRDNVLCKTCEKKLGELESKIATEFLQKFRIDRFKNNFISSQNETEYEVFEPKKIANKEFLAYFYSIIFRVCKVYEFEDNHSYLKTSELIKIKKFLFGYLYQKNSFENEISKFKVLIVFNKYSEKSKFIATSNDLKNPYTFYFCDAIILLFTTEIDNNVKEKFGGILNSIEQNTSKIIVGPENMYNTLSSIISRILSKKFITNGVNFLSKLNGKSYQDNLMEANELILKYEQDEIHLPMTKAFEDLKKKYSS